MNLRFVIGVFIFLPVGAFAQQSQSCNDLRKLALPNTKIILAEQIEAGTATDLPANAAPSTLPTLCRVVLQLTPSSDSAINMELWMPLQWNFTFRGLGNSGFAGAIDYVSLAGGVLQGYAIASTDTGHDAGNEDASWALDHPQKVIDFGYRAIHLMTQVSQQVMSAFYGAPARHSFFSSCSDGGREALMEAERYPGDYDGIVAGDPAYNWSGFMTNAVATAKLMDPASSSYIPAAKLSLINAAVLAACDSLDGVQDGIIANPPDCHFNPRTLLCTTDNVTSGNTNGCLLQSQVATLQSLYAGIFTLDNGLIFPGYVPGGEVGANGWTPWITGSGGQPGALAVYGQNFFANMVYNNPHWTSQYTTSDQAYKEAVQRVSTSVDATDPNLAPFFNRGGKLIIYHGWSDGGVSPLNSIRFFDLANFFSGPKASSSMQLYMVPGMQHCIGGAAPTFFGQVGWFEGEGVDDPQHDVNLAIEQWVNQGIAPTSLIASQYTGPLPAGQIAPSRPICPYPQTAKYDGSGDTSKATSFACVAPTH